MSRREPRPAPAHVNEVRLVGRVAAPATRRVLPSGDDLAELRLVVDRARPRPRGDGRPAVRVDTIDVTCWTARAKNRVLALRPGDVCAVEGTLARRFFRTPAGPASRYTVEADVVRRLWRDPDAAATTAPAPAPAAGSEPGPRHAGDTEAAPRADHAPPVR